MGRHKKEKWATIDITGIKRNYYQVSSWGRVRNARGKILAPYKDKDGYLKYTLTTDDGRKKHYFGHRLVAMYFVPNPDNKPEVNHLRPNDKANLYYEYLEWATHMENVFHARKHKLQTIVSCEAHGMATISYEDAHRICRYMQDGLSNKQIIDKFGKTGKKERERFRGVLKHIRAKRTWLPVSNGYNF